MAKEMRISSPSGFPTGNCKVMIESSSYNCSSTVQNLEISVSNAAKISISVVQGESGSLMSNLSFVLVNPKDADDQSKTLMQEALRLYVKELPTMNYAANTGKESNFLERRVSSGKYCTLLLRLNIGGLFTEVIAALTYQIIPADTQYAEVPLAAVSSKYQHKAQVSLKLLKLRTMFARKSWSFARWAISTKPRHKIALIRWSALEEDQSALKACRRNMSASKVCENPYMACKKFIGIQECLQELEKKLERECAT